LSLILSICLMLGLCACGQKVEEAPAETAPTWQEQYDLGIRYLSEGNYEEAIIAFTAAIEIDPKQPDAYIKTAEAYVAAGDLDAAIAILERGAQTTGDEALRAYLEQLQAEPLTVLTYQAAYEPDGTICFSVRYFYNEAGYLTRSERMSYDDNGSTTGTRSESWEYSDASGKCVHTRTDGTTEERTMRLGSWLRWGSFNDICCDPATREEVGEDGILENGNPDPVNSYPRFDYAVYTFDEAGYPLTITTYGHEGEVLGTAVAEWETIYPVQ